MTFTPFTAHFDRTVEESLKRWHVPGVAFSALHKESTGLKGYGLADVKSKAPVDPSTTFFLEQALPKPIYVRPGQYTSPLMPISASLRTTAFAGGHTWQELSQETLFFLIRLVQRRLL